MLYHYTIETSAGFLLPPAISLQPYRYAATHIRNNCSDMLQLEKI